VLEVASGTGQHAQHFAAAQPGWEWQPSEATAEALPVVAARCAGQPNVRPPLLLDVRVQPWPVGGAADDAAIAAAFHATDDAAYDAIYVANLLHIAPWAATSALLQGAVRCLKPGGVLAVYGPFIVDGEPLAASNAAFDTDLRMRDARWGLRSLQQVQREAQSAGLVLAERCAMPANNMMLRFAAAS
jgi:SAM-dependent methyltransferase